MQVDAPCCTPGRPVTLAGRALRARPWVAECGFSLPQVLPPLLQHTIASFLGDHAPLPEVVAKPQESYPSALSPQPQ